MFAVAVREELAQFLHSDWKLETLLSTLQNIGLVLVQATLFCRLVVYYACINVFLYVSMYASPRNWIQPSAWNKMWTNVVTINAVYSTVNVAFIIRPMLRTCCPRVSRMLLLLFACMSTIVLQGFDV